MRGGKRMGGDEDAFGDEVSRGRASRNETVGGQKRKLSRMAKRLLLGFVGLLTLFALLVAYLTHGFLWSVYVPIYSQLLHSIPSPPGLMSETDRLTVNPELPWGYRRYEVDMSHEETVRFFVTELPPTGWELLEHREMSGESEARPGVHLRVNKILLSKHQKYWLIVNVFTETNAEGVRTDNTEVTLEIHRDEKSAFSRY
jgi:hypothetical protein